MSKERTDGGNSQYQMQQARSRLRDAIDFIQDLEDDLVAELQENYDSMYASTSLGHYEHLRESLSKSAHLLDRLMDAHRKVIIHSNLKKE